MDSQISAASEASLGDVAPQRLRPPPLNSAANSTVTKTCPGIQNVKLHSSGLYARTLERFGRKCAVVAHDRDNNRRSSMPDFAGRGETSIRRFSID
jgi:hypothetical protein